MDKIYIRDMLLRCIIGIYPEERKNKQDVVINICLHVDLSAACAKDDFARTVDYKRVKLDVVELVESSSYFLIEAMAQEIARICTRDERVAQVDVTVDKPGALRFARSVAVEITRKRHDLWPPSLSE